MGVPPVYKSIHLLNSISPVGDDAITPVLKRVIPLIRRYLGLAPPQVFATGDRFPHGIIGYGVFSKEQYPELRAFYSYAISIVVTVTKGYPE
jgi:hypothetical protein